MLKRVQHDKKKCVIPNLFRNLEFGNDKELIAFALVPVRGTVTNRSLRKERMPGNDHFTTIIALIQIFCMLHEHPHLFSE
jgi:hypothetical protein